MVELREVTRVRRLLTDLLTLNVLNGTNVGLTIRVGLNGRNMNYTLEDLAVEANEDEGRVACAVLRLTLGVVRYLL